MFIQINIASNIKTTLPKTENAKHFLKFMEESFQTADKSLPRTLMGTFTTMKFYVSRTMHDHVIELKNVATRRLGMEVEQNFLIQFIINSLLSEYDNF